MMEMNHLNFQIKPYDFLYLPIQHCDINFES